jgi:hypothetical protein
LFGYLDIGFKNETDCDLLYGETPFAPATPDSGWRAKVIIRPVANGISTREGPYRWRPRAPAWETYND